MLTEDEIFANETYTIDLLKEIKREGIKDYIQYIENSDFFLHRQVQNIIEIILVDLRNMASIY